MQEKKGIKIRETFSLNYFIYALYCCPVMNQISVIIFTSPWKYV